VDYNTTTQVTTPYNYTVWRATRILWPLIQARTRVNVGNGRKTSFLEDKWNGTIVLRQARPVLFTLCQWQHATIANMWTKQGWNIGLRRQLNDWEIENVTELLSHLVVHTSLAEEIGALLWQEASKGDFSVKSAYKDLNRTGGHEKDWPWKMIWKPKVPYKVNCFTWLLAKEAVLTHENLNKRGYQLASR